MVHQGRYLRSEYSNCIFDSRAHSGNDGISSLGWRRHWRKYGRTWGGPRIVPFQLDMSKSSPSESPYEHASVIRTSATYNYSLGKKGPTCPKTLFALLELLQKPKVSGYFRTHYIGKNSSHKSDRVMQGLLWYHANYAEALQALWKKGHRTVKPEC